jgi:hypothetical protein
VKLHIIACLFLLACTSVQEVTISDPPAPTWTVEGTLAMYGECRRAGNQHASCVCFIKTAQYLDPKPEVEVTAEERAVAAQACGVVDLRSPPEKTGGEAI